MKEMIPYAQLNLQSNVACSLMELSKVSHTMVTFAFLIQKQMRLMKWISQKSRRKLLGKNSEIFLTKVSMNGTVTTLTSSPLVQLSSLPLDFLNYFEELLFLNINY